MLEQLINFKEGKHFLLLALKNIFRTLMIKTFYCSGTVAAKIMEKLGYKEGSGLGKNQQGMSMALQVEKTSKRGGKIIHEKDILKSKFICTKISFVCNYVCYFTQINCLITCKVLNVRFLVTVEAEKPKPESMTNANLLKNPSKVILLRVCFSMS